MTHPHLSFPKNGALISTANTHGMQYSDNYSYGSGGGLRQRFAFFFQKSYDLTIGGANAETDTFVPAPGQCFAVPRHEILKSFLVSYSPSFFFTSKLLINALVRTYVPVFKRIY